MCGVVRPAIGSWIQGDQRLRECFWVLRNTRSEGVVQLPEQVPSINGRLYIKTVENRVATVLLAFKIVDKGVATGLSVLLACKKNDKGVATGLYQRLRNKLVVLGSPRRRWMGSRLSYRLSRQSTSTSRLDYLTYWPSRKSTRGRNCLVGLQESR